MKLAKYVSMLVAAGFTANAHQGCSTDAALDTLFSDAGVERVANALLHVVERDIDIVIKDLNSTTPEQFAKLVIDRYHVIQGILAFAGVKLPLLQK
ncbi:hypothetical protein FBU59_001971 [Linderina macrospora]|uniref:Uncharacterized protein n=1 Tax=Linderina macrospora TaxID=4868 RepID=A0ACC1JCI0_9FUNG|nr:hypothetical protein FBU59_001971 [Linderina macrospora]